MYTECPQCRTAFRLTAAVLRKAHGRVRCGGCGNTFDALDNLSEEQPGTDPGNTQTAHIFEEQSRALLESLDDLAGKRNVRIEDTGVEWRVLDVDDVDDGGDDSRGDDPDPTGTIRWTLEEPQPAANEPDDDTRSMAPDADDDEAPGPDTPTRRAADRAAAGPASAQDEARPDTQASLDLQPDDDELRFDDNTPLPDEYFRPVDPSVARRAEPPADDDADEAGPVAAADDATPAELELGGADDWQDLLAEVDAAGNGTVAAPGTTAGRAADDAAGSAGDAQAAGERAEVSRDEPQDSAAAALPDEPPDERGNELPHARSAGSPAQTSAATTDDASEELTAESADEPPGGPSDPRAAPGPRPATAASLAADDNGAEAPVDDEDEHDRSVAMEIDQELMRAAEAARESPARATASGRQNVLVETIIMEGDTVTDLLMEAEAAELDASMSAQDGAGSDEHGGTAGGRRRAAAIAAVVVLGLVLAAQLVHANRESLATIDAVNRAIAPIYRALGRPLTPAWDIRGWQFESTSGSTDDTEQRLTIYSRIANRAPQALPYPLVHVSLTDRFEEVIGSRILEPAQYLAGNADLARPVTPGDEFTAVIAIDGPAPEATGFKLNVCYRVADARLRCAIEDFRN